MENDIKLENISDKLIDIELAKSDNRNSKIRRYLPAAVLVVFSYYSFLFAFGLSLGYIGSKIFSKYLIENGKVDCIFLDCGKYKIHLHHWILGALLLLLVWVIDYFYLPRFFVGVVCGIIAHDIYDFNDWHKILIKKKNNY
jgi:hypothetical protein